jgi:hypothetical protein
MRSYHSSRDYRLPGGSARVLPVSVSIFGISACSLYLRPAADVLAAPASSLGSAVDAPLPVVALLAPLLTVGLGTTLTAPAGADGSCGAGRMV